MICGERLTQFAVLAPNCRPQAVPMAPTVVVAERGSRLGDSALVLGGPYLGIFASGRMGNMCGGSSRATWRR